MEQTKQDTYPGGQGPAFPVTDMPTPFGKT